jgi:VWFA-related protein
MVALATAQEQRYVLTVDVEFVHVTATVIDGTGKTMDRLTADDFQLLEDGQPQKISFFSNDPQAPLSIGVLIDISGSLQYKLQQALQTVREIAATLSPSDEMFILTFNTRAEVRQRFTGNVEEIRRSLHNVRANGETAVYDAMSLGLREMENAKHGKQILLLLTDCFDTRSKIKAGEIEGIVQTSGVQIYAVGIEDGPKSRKRTRYPIYEYMLNRLTSAGGGRLVRMDADQEYDLRGLAATLMGEFRQGYTLGYYPADAQQNPGFRRVEVRVLKPGARVLGKKLHLQGHPPSR